MKILLFGDTGSLGKEFKSLFIKENINFNSVNRKKIKNRFSLSSLNSIIKKNKPKLIINCIALTGLIYCQKRRKMAYKVNTQIPFTILKAIKNTNIKFIHFSTDAVFKGKIKNKIYSERDKPRPGSIYGKSKYKADKKVLQSKNTLLVRLPLLFGPTHKKQIVSKLLKSVSKGHRTYVADDVYSTPIYTPDLCRFILDNCVKKEKIFEKNLIHLTGSKTLSMYKLIYNLSKNIKGINLKNIIRVKDAYFKTGIKIKPKNLGLTSQYNSCIKKINYKVGKKLL